jgi:hypothetical protein
MNCIGEQAIVAPAVIGRHRGWMIRRGRAPLGDNAKHE